MVPHQAIEVALAALTGPGGGAHPVAVLERHGVVAVLVDNPVGRAIVFVEHRDGQWVGPGIIGGQFHRTVDRRTETTPGQPIQRLSRSRYSTLTPDGEPSELSWFGVTGIAAQDAAAVTITSSIDSMRVDVGDDGLVFAVAQGRTDEKPGVVIHTRDGGAHLAP
ncbi:hypothetical protein ACQP1O_23410 [Nocardia sp. CA-151230]|uniref:hypothetical protein n=1 Tax=Nocardia sp. CA-151230 TaxID=3239982 RepID=UPI003D8E99F6